MAVKDVSALPASAPLRVDSWRAAPWKRLLLLVPLTAFLAVFFVYPMFDLLARSFASQTGTFTIEHYRSIFSTPIYLRLFWNTFEIAFFVTIITLLIGYVLAYYISVARPLVASALMFCTLIPFFTSVLVRTYGWMVILSPEGIANGFLAWLGIAPVQLLYTRTGVMIGMVYTLLPYMVLTLYSVFRGIDDKLLRAGANLGATPLQVFLHVFWPLSLPGVAGGGLLVFILALGYFVTPALMGGSSDQMIAMLIYENIDKTLNWEFAAALSIILLACTLVCLWAYDRIVGLNKLLEARQ